MSLEKFLNVDIKKLKEKKEKRELEELEPNSKSLDNEFELKNLIRKRKEEYRLKKERRQIKKTN